MSLQNFIPELWSSELLVSLTKALVYGQDNVINRDYEGMIKDQGDTVHISAIGEITISDYVRNANLTAAQELTSASTTLVISQAKSFNFKIDDVDAAQMNTSVLTEAMRRAAYGLGNVADQYISNLYVGIASQNQVYSDGSPFTPTVSSSTGFNDAYEQLVNLSVRLDEANVPGNGRWCIVPPWFHGLLLKDNRFVGYGTSGSRDTLMNGAVGTAVGFEIMASNNVPNNAGTLYKVIAGHKMAWTFADQISKVVAYRPELGFSDAIKGLHVYGAKILRPDALAVLTTNRPTGS